MTVKPIIFSGPMVKALLTGTKSQTRRVLKLPAVWPGPKSRVGQWEASVVGGEGIVNDSGRPYSERACVWHTYGGAIVLPPYEVGDLLYVRESFATHPCAKGAVHQKGDGHPWGSPIYKATFGAALSPVCEGFTKWKPSIHMPRWASRLTLEVTDVRVQRLQDISEEDARAEGTTAPPDGHYGDGYCDDYRSSFCDLWNSLHGPDAWSENPWICAVSFTVHHCNVDDLLRQRAVA